MSFSATPLSPGSLPEDRGGQSWAAEANAPFSGLIDAVIVEAPVEFVFDGAIARRDAMAAWTWVRRDLAPSAFEANGAIEDAMAPVLNRWREAADAAKSDPDLNRRLRAQLGGDEQLDRLPFVFEALRNHALLEKAEALGRAINAITDEEALATALRALPRKDTVATALLMTAAMGEILSPSRVIVATSRLAGGGTEEKYQRAGFGRLIEAMLIHAQNQIHRMRPNGTFDDIDLTCRALDRYHRLVRAVTGYVELSRGGAWSKVVGGLTRTASQRLEQRMRGAIGDINLCLKARDVEAAADSVLRLNALGGLYLLASVRECRDTLAVNALFDQAWDQAGQTIESHVGRNLDLLRARPDDALAAARLETGVKLAEIRFNAEYAETLRRAISAARR